MFCANEDYEDSTDSEKENIATDVSNKRGSKRASKSPVYHSQYLTAGDYNKAIDGAIKQEKIAAKQALKPVSLPHEKRLRQEINDEEVKNGKSCSKEKEVISSLPSGSQLSPPPVSQESTKSLSFSLPVETVIEDMETKCQLDYKTYVDRAISSAVSTVIEKVRNIVDEAVRSIVAETVDKVLTNSQEKTDIVLSAIENVSIEAPTRRKMPKKSGDSGDSKGTWIVMAGKEKKPMCLVTMDVKKLLLANSKEHLIKNDRAPEDSLCKFLDDNLDIDTICGILHSPQVFGMTIADFMMPKEVQMHFKFHHSLTRSSARADMPESKMKSFRKAMMYCGLASLCLKEERKVYIVAALEAINGRASHWRNGRKRVSYNSENIPTYYKISDFPMPGHPVDSMSFENNSPAPSQDDF